VSGARGWIAAAAGAIVIAAAIYLSQPHEDSPEHSTDSDAVNGASAALLFAQAMGHKTEQMSGSFATPAPGGILFVFTPTSLYTSEEADSLRSWVGRGGLLVYAAEQGDPELDRAFDVSRFDALVEGGQYAATPLLGAVTTVAGGASVVPLDPAPRQVTLLRTRSGYSAGYVQRVGQGRVVVLADPLLLCNGHLEQADNAVLLADLLAPADPAATVTFDEYHHGLTVSDFAPQAWLTTPWGAALLWLLVAVFFGLLLRGRRFGPLVERPPEVARSDAEWSVAVGQLLRRSSARAVTLGLLVHATEREVAAQNGLPMQPRESFWNALWVRAPDVARELAEVEDSFRAASIGERQLLGAARRLHRIAHPSAAGTSRDGTNR
jgi:Domain of unknown function (DUF4350)